MKINDAPMDEFEWEEFMKKNDAMVDKFSSLMEKYMDDPNCDEIIAREMGWNHKIEDDGIERPWLEEFNDSLGIMTDEIEEGEAWKKAAGIDIEVDLPDFENDPLYQLGFLFAVDFRNWFVTLIEEIRSEPEIIEALKNSAIPGAKIAGAASIDDDDKDQLGFRLANYKRGLIAANKTLTALRTVHEKNIIAQQNIFPLIKQSTELRNALAVRVMEVRDRFNRI